MKEAAKTQRQLHRREAALCGNRISELWEKPISGDFDIAHLRAIHAYIFQDLPYHRPGVTRTDTVNWTKQRQLERREVRYVVPYLSRGAGARIAAILDAFGGPGALRGLKVSEAAARLARLYADLDYVHGFYEGNSRALREFTRELAFEAGIRLDWIKAGVGAKQRNNLYIARDVAVYERAWPGLDEARAMQTMDRREYEAFFTLEKLRRLARGRTLEKIVADALGASQRE